MTFLVIIYQKNLSTQLFGKMFWSLGFLHILTRVYCFSRKGPGRSRYAM